MKNFVDLLKIFYGNHARLLGSIIIFISVIFLLGVPYSNWGFFGDDFGNILNSQIHGFSDLIKFIKFGHVGDLFFPSNHIGPPVHFFNVLYRPLVFFSFGFLSMFFGVNAKAYFLTIVLIHAINSVCLFNIFSYFVENAWAFLGAMLFAFHPTLVGWFGWIAALQYQIDVLAIILMFFLLKKFVEGNSILYLIIAGFIYFNALLMRETLIVLPILTAVAILLIKKPLLSVKKILSVFVLFSSVAILYLLIRLHFYPFQNALFHSEFLPRIYNSIFMKFLHFTYALPGLYVCSWSHFYVRFLLTFAFLILLALLFIFNQQKRFLIFLIVCVLALSWCQMYNYSNRYFYVAVPFFILFILVDISYFKTPFLRLNSIIRKSLSLLLIFAIFQSVLYLKNDLSVREERSVRINRAFDELVKNGTIIDKIVYFIDIPYDYFLSGVAQAVWLRGCNLGLPIYSYDVGLNQKSINCLKRLSAKQSDANDGVMLADIFRYKLLPLQEKNQKNVSCWVFWDNQNFRFFEVDVYENDFY